MTAKKIFRATVCFMAFILMASSIYFVPNAQALTYDEFRGSNTALRESYARSSSEAPIIRDVKVPSETLSRYDMYEIVFQLDATYTNPFDPDDIQVDGIFVYPSGKQVTVPDALNQTASSANRILTNAGFNIKIDGAMNFDEGVGARVVSQTPAAGELVPYGSVVTIELRHTDGTD